MEASYPVRYIRMEEREGFPRASGNFTQIPFVLFVFPRVVRLMAAA